MTTPFVPTPSLDAACCSGHVSIDAVTSAGSTYLDLFRTRLFREDPLSRPESSCLAKLAKGPSFGEPREPRKPVTQPPDFRLCPGITRFPNRVGTNGVFAEGPQILYILSCICLSAHMMPHHAIFCHMLSTFSRDNSLWGIAALLRRPRLS